ncbi:hypothetical protein HK096_000075, partial [Nowakowskiella sp. JEL0078]
KKKSPLVLVLSPTRELAMQTFTTISTFGEAFNTKVNSVCLYGGVSRSEHKNVLRTESPEIVVATPGRLLDLIEDGSCDLSLVDFVVLDEADRMLDAGFEEAITQIFSHLAKKRQTVMFSATWPTSIQKLSSTFLKTPIHITIGSTDLSANTDVSQTVYVMEQFDKNNKLMELLKKHHDLKKNKGKIIVFALYKKEAARLESLIVGKGYKAVGIHGDLSQPQRTLAIEKFRDGSSPILVATDVAARGLDIPDVEVVINYTYPLTTEDYCHRIGRTGRAGKKGISYTFFTSAEKGLTGSL